MNRDKKAVYLVSLISLAVLFIVLITVKGDSRMIGACILAPMALANCLLIKKRSARSINKKDVLLLMTVLAVITSAGLEMTGIHFGFYKNPYFVNTSVLLRYVLPITVIIISTEIIRNVLTAQKSLAVNIIAFMICVIGEVFTVSTLADVLNFNIFMNVVGMTLLPAITANILYNHISKNYGSLPNVVYRLIISLYVYCLPQITAANDALRSCIKIILPILIFSLILAMFQKGKKNAVNKGGKLTFAGVLLSLGAIVAVAMLISCQFRFGALVIATESMTGEINKGDMIIYERYDDQKIEEGQVIVFSQVDAKIVHRVVKIEKVGGQTRYYTQGDANMTVDSGYRTDADIVGLTDVKISFIGYPTLWLRDVLQGTN